MVSRKQTGYCNASLNFMRVRYTFWILPYRRHTWMPDNKRSMMIFLFCTITQEINYEFLFSVRYRRYRRYRLKWVSLFFSKKKTKFFIENIISRSQMVKVPTLIHGECVLVLPGPHNYWLQRVSDGKLTILSLGMTSLHHH